MSENEKPSDFQVEMEKLKAEVEETARRAEAGDADATEMLKTLDRAAEKFPPGETVKETAQGLHELRRLRAKLDQLTKSESTEMSMMSRRSQRELQEVERKKHAREDRTLMNDLQATEIAKNELLLQIWEKEVTMKQEAHVAYLKDVKDVQAKRAADTTSLQSLARSADSFVRTMAKIATVAERVAKWWVTSQ
jgi:hypothetical protein